MLSLVADDGEDADGPVRQVGEEEQESKDGEMMMVRCRSVYVQVYVLYNIPNILSSTATGSILQRNPVCGQVCILPRNLSIVQI